MEHESLKEDLRKAREVLARMESQTSNQDQRNSKRSTPLTAEDIYGQHGSEFTVYEDFRISRSREEIGGDEIDRNSHSGKSARDKDEEGGGVKWPQLNDTTDAETMDLLDEGLELLDSVRVSSSANSTTSKLTPSLAARLGPEVNVVRAKVQSLVHSTQSKLSEEQSYQPAQPEQVRQKQRRREKEEKENRVVEILDSDQEEGEAQDDDNNMEVIHIDDDDEVLESHNHKKQRQRSISVQDPDVTIVEEKSRGPTLKKDKKRRRSPSR